MEQGGARCQHTQDLTSSRPRAQTPGMWWRDFMTWCRENNAGFLPKRAASIKLASASTRDGDLDPPAEEVPTPSEGRRS